MMYSISNKLDFENMAQDLVFFFCYISVPAQRSKHMIFNKVKIYIYIGFTHLNLSIFPYTQLYTLVPGGS